MSRPWRGLGLALAAMLSAAPQLASGEPSAVAARRVESARSPRQHSAPASRFLRRCVRAGDDLGDPRFLSGCYATVARQVDALIERASQLNQGLAGSRLGRRLPELSRNAEQLGDELRELVATPGPAAPGAGASEARLELWKRLERVEASVLRFTEVYSREAVLVSRGGISLGSWQAGFLYALTEGLKKRRDALGRGGQVFPVVTGASAGAVNAVAAAVSGCERGAVRPDQSLYHQIWVPMGLSNGVAGGGLVEGPAGRLHLFSEAAVANTMQRALDHVERDVGGLPALPCETRIGFSVTHLSEKRLSVETSPNDRGRRLSVFRQKEVFELLVQVQARAGRGLLSATNLHEAGDDGASQMRAFLGSGPEARLSAEMVMDAARASGAFPLAFPPVTLSYSFDGEGHVDEFIDGGAFDNMPLGVALEMLDARRQLSDESGTPSELLPFSSRQPARYVMVEPNIESWKSRSTGEKGPATGDVLSTYLGFAGSMVASTKDSGLAEVLYHAPELLDHGEIYLPRRHLPVAGSFFSAFLGFLERDFRVFDYYVGLADGLRAFREDETLVGIADDALPLSDVARATISAGPAGDARLDCILDYFDAAVSLEPVHRRIRREQLPDSCQQAALSNFGAVLVASHNLKARLTVNRQGMTVTGDGTREFIEELIESDFSFTDTPGAPETADDVLFQLRRTFGSRVSAVSAEQSSALGGRVFDVAGQTILDAAITRQQPRHVLGLGLTLRGLDAYWAVNAQRWWLNRLELGGRVARFGRVDLVDGRNPYRIQLTPGVRVGLASLGLDRYPFALLRFSTGFGLGYDFFFTRAADEVDRGRLALIFGGELNLVNALALRLDAHAWFGPENLFGPDDVVQGSRSPVLYTGTVAYQINWW